MELCGNEGDVTVRRTRPFRFYERTTQRARPFQAR